MKREWPQAIIMLSGAALIIIGVGAVLAQMYVESQRGIFHGDNTFSNNPINLVVSSGYVGVQMIAIGAVLELIGYVATLPWRWPINSK
jgi:hypothetical protein